MTSHLLFEVLPNVFQVSNNYMSLTPTPKTHIYIYVYTNQLYYPDISTNTIVVAFNIQIAMYMGYYFCYCCCFVISIWKVSLTASKPLSFSCFKDTNGLLRPVTPKWESLKTCQAGEQLHPQRAHPACVGTWVCTRVVTLNQRPMP